MPHRIFHISSSNTAHLWKRFFHILAWMGCWVLCTGCATNTPCFPTAESAGPVSQIIRFYQGPLDHLSAVRYGGCPMEPHCSAYALEAVDRHGPLMGLVMTFDRLIRCGNDEIHLSPEVFVNGRRRTHDPVAANEWNSNAQLKETRQWNISIE